MSQRRDIEITLLHTGAAVRFPYDAGRIARFRAAFPRALWGEGTRSWHIPGKLAARRAEIWRAREYDRWSFDPWEQAKADDALAFDFAGSEHVKAGRGGIRIRPTVYAPDVRQVARTMRGRWDPALKEWVLPSRFAEQALSLVPTIEAMIESAITSQSARQIAGVADAARYAETLAVEQTRRMSRISRRDLVLADAGPEIGATVEKGGVPCVYTGYGAPFILTSRHIGEHGAEWLPHLGEKARYAYWREHDRLP